MILEHCSAAFCIATFGNHHHSILSVYYLLLNLRLLSYYHLYRYCIIDHLDKTLKFSLAYYVHLTMST